jgi:hypothetical protein
MPAQQQKQVKGGKCLTTSETKKQHYVTYRSLHGGVGNKIVGSKEHRGCGPLARYNRRKQVEVNAIENGKRGLHPTLGELPYSDKTFRLLADKRRMK